MNTPCQSITEALYTAIMLICIWQFHIITDILLSRMGISHSYRHVVVKNGSFTLLLTSTGQEWQLHMSVDI